jgi:hypothetical protein
MPTFVVPTSTASNLLAQAGTLLSDPGTLSVVVLAAGIGFGFYIITRLIGLIPKGRGTRRG